MQLFELLPGKNCKGKCLKICRVAIRWEGQNDISAIVAFDITRERTDTKAVGNKAVCQKYRYNQEDDSGNGSALSGKGKNDCMCAGNGAGRGTMVLFYGVNC